MNYQRIHKINPRSKSTQKEPTDQFLKLSNQNNLQISRDNNGILSNIGRKCITPSVELPKKMQQNNQINKTIVSTSNQQAEHLKLFTSLNKSSLNSPERQHHNNSVNYKKPPSLSQHTPTQSINQRISPNILKSYIQSQSNNTKQKLFNRKTMAQQNSITSKNNNNNNNNNKKNMSFNLDEYMSFNEDYNIQNKGTNSSNNNDDIFDGIQYTDPNLSRKSCMQSIKQEQLLKKQLANSYFDKGKQLFKENKLKEAAEAFGETVQNDSKNLEALYMLGVCYLTMQEFQKSIKEFLILLDQNQYFKKNVYLLISIAYKKLNDISMAIKMLSRAIVAFPKYYDAYIYRGKLNVKCKKYQKAINDFEQSMEICPQKALGFVGKADCLRIQGDFQESIRLYSQALSKDDIIQKVAYLKRAITYIEAKEYQNAMDDLQLIIDDDPNNSEAYYFKGMVLYKLENVTDALLSFEQAIKHNNSRKAVTKSLYEIAKMKIEQRDFYQAFYTLQRADYLDVDKPLLEKFRIFTDGVTFLMKRKYQDGVDNLSSLIKNQNVGDFLKPLLFNYRAYGLFCLGKHQKVIEDLQILESLDKFDQSAQYNKIVCEGIIQSQSDNYEIALNLFNQATKINVKKMEPYFYKAMTLVQYSNKMIPKSDKVKRLQYIQNALQCLNRAEELNNQSAVLYYIRGIIRFYLMKLEESIQDLDKAIDKSEDNIADYFYVRGLIYACQKNFKSAINDFSIAINLDENFSDAYINRAKVFHLLNDRNSAFLDLQKYITIKPNDPDIHLWAGNLLFNIGAYEDAIKAYSHAGNIQKNEKILLLRSKCYVVLKELNSAISDMQKLIDINNDKKIIFDRECLNALKIASQFQQSKKESDGIQILNQSLQKLKKLKNQGKIQEGYVFFKSDWTFYKGVIYFYLKNYEKAIRKFNKSLDQFKKRSYSVQSLLQEAKNVNNLEKDNDEEENDDEEIQSIEQYEFDNMTYNIYEFQYNIAICYLLNQKFEEAHKLLQILLEMLPKDEIQNYLEKFIAYIEEEINLRGKTVATAISSQNSNHTNEKDILNNNTQIKIKQKTIQENDNNEIQTSLIMIFPTHNRLCSIFPAINLPFTNQKHEARLSFCLPTVVGPSMLPKFDENLIWNLNPTSVENKPEAPWIKRTEHGIMFTENILQQQDDIDLTESKKSSVCLEDSMLNDKEQKKKQQKQKNGYDYEELMNDNSYFIYGDGKDDPDLLNNEEIQEQIVDKNKIKLQLQLDFKVQNKLDKLMKKKQDTLN